MPGQDIRAGLLAALLLIAPGAVAQPAADPERLESRIEALGAFGATPEGGVRKLAYSDADIAGRDYVMGLMRDLGLDIRIDSAGNILARRAGTDPSLPPILFGSHTDSVPDGGKYDGPAGVLTAIEAVEMLNAHDIETRHPLEVVVFAAEEAGLIGSKAFAGLLEPEVLAETAQAGMTIGAGIDRIGGDAADIGDAAVAPGDYAAYVELHIEQGAVLAENNTDIGVVQGIVGIDWWDVIVTGAANHAGTTPMDRRRDALVAASELVLAVNRIVSGSPGAQVGTVGRVEAFPGAPNVVPGRVEASLEIRDLSNDRILEFFGRIEAEAARIAERSGTEIRFRKTPIHEIAAETDPRLRDIIAAAAEARGYSIRRMPSGAGHDAQAVAHVAPIGMIFVPSRGGISHAPDEFTAAEDLARGATVLFDTIRALDRGEGF